LTDQGEDGCKHRRQKGVFKLAFSLFGLCQALLVFSWRKAGLVPKKSFTVASIVNLLKLSLNAVATIC